MRLHWSDISADPYLAELRTQFGDDALLGRVVAQDGPVLEVVSPHGITYARPSGRLAFQIKLRAAPIPAVGDYVEIDPDQTTVVRDVLPRRSVFERKEAGKRTAAQIVCANIDRAVIVTTAPPATAREGSDRPALNDFSVRRIERFIATLDSRVEAVVVLNKSDLITETDRVRDSVSAQLPGIEICMVSARSGAGVDQVRRLLPPGSTAVLVGSSGSGKSTLIGQLTGHELRTSSIRETDGKGRHTTTGRRTYALDGGGLLIDTPGIREVQLWTTDGGSDRLGAAFAEIDELASECRFSDCSHLDEPGCAVRAAVRDGRITSDRYLSYLELHSEQLDAEARREKQDRLTERRAARTSRKRRRSRGG